MKTIGRLAAALTAVALAAVGSARASEGPDEATIARDAYIYLYPLVTMEVTRQQLINLPPSSGLGGPMNVFVNVPGFPTAEMKTVVRPNFDTLYSSAWLDLSAGPLVISAPDTQGRYYLLPMLDMWTDVFASPGWRTTGTAAADYLVTPPGWTGDVPAGLTRIAAPTPIVWIIGRTKTDGPADYAAVHKLQAGFRVTPLAAWGRAPEPPPVQKIDPAIDVKTPPKLQVDGMSGPAFFAKAAELLKLHPPHLTDEPILAQMKRLGLVPGASFDASAQSPAVKAAIDAAPARAQELMAWKVPKLAAVVDGWSMNVDTMGVYGNYYLKRAIIAQQGLGANLPEDAIYPLNFVDAGGHPLDGTHRYTLRFPPGQQPPADAFWSVTLYDAAGYQVANPLDRFALSSWMPLKTEPDGTLVLYIQPDSPGADRESNWLPAPKGPFNLTMRLYAPRTDALTGRWNPPAVTRAGAVLPLGTP